MVQGVFNAYCDRFIPKIPSTNGPSLTIQATLVHHHIESMGIAAISSVMVSFERVSLRVVATAVDFGVELLIFFVEFVKLGDWFFLRMNYRLVKAFIDI